MMKRIHVIYFFLLYTSGLHAQISNGGFEENSVNCCNGGSCGNITPFNDLLVDNWKASHGSPHLTKSDLGCSGFNNIVFSGTDACFMSYKLDNDSLNPEGIFTEFHTTKNNSYNFTIRARRIGAGPSRIKIKLVNGLSNYATGTRSPTIPNPTQQQLIVEKILADTFLQIVVEGVIPDRDYTQLWIYCLDGDIIVDGTNMLQTCCEPFKEYQNIINPPSTHVNDYIKAGKLVNPALTQGPVIIKKQVGMVIFQAGNDIELLDGFETEDSANFEAIIEPCSNTPMQVHIGELIPLEYPCERQLKAYPCFGSGFYKVLWSDGIQDLGLISKAFSPEEHPSITAKIIDTRRNDTITQVINFVNPPFFGDINFLIPSVITPDGDGINEVYKALDTLRPNTTKYAYNIFRYELSIHGADHFTYYDISSENRINGFADGSITWTENYCAEVPSNDRFLLVVLRMVNCSHDDLFSLTLSIFCPSPPLILQYSNSQEQLSDVEILKLIPLQELLTQYTDSLSINSIFELYPNPSTDFVTLKFSNTNSQPATLEIINAAGLVVKNISIHTANEGINFQVISLEDLAQGVYECKFKVGDTVTHKKLVKHRF